VKHKSAPVVYNEIPIEKNVRLRMQTHRLSLDKKGDFEPRQRVALESIGLMQQHNYDALIHEQK
jgi:hypothetical protein